MQTTTSLSCRSSPLLTSPAQQTKKLLLDTFSCQKTSEIAVFTALTRAFPTDASSLQSQSSTILLAQNLNQFKTHLIIKQYFSYKDACSIVKMTFKTQTGVFPLGRKECYYACVLMNTIST